MNRFFQILNHRHASLVCILFALVNRTALAIFAMRISRDKQLQFTMLENFQAGKGLSLVKYFTTDLSVPVYDHTLRFPPGYSIVVLPFLKLFDNNSFLAAMAIDILSAVFFVLIIRLLCTKLNFPLYLKNIVTIITGCTQYIFFMESASADILSLDFILAGMVAAMHIINSNKKCSYYEIAGYGLLFFMPAFLRYMYIPFVILFPILIFYAGVAGKNEAVKKNGIRLTISTLIFLAMLMIWLLSVSSQFVQPTERGFFPKQLLAWYPFFIGSFTNIDFAAMMMQKLLHAPYHYAFYFLVLCNLGLLPLFFVMRKTVFPKRKFSFFPVAGTILSVLILLQLAFLTLTNKPQTSFGIWNYSSEGRYFAFITIFLVLLVFCAVSKENRTINSFSKVFLTTLFILMGIETVHSVYYNIKLPFRYREMRNLVAKYEQPRNYFDTVLTNTRKEFPGADVYVSSPDSYYLNFAAAKGAKAIYDPLNLNTATLHPPQKSVLLFVVDKRQQEKFKPYLQKKGLRLITVISTTYYYIEELHPGK